MAEPQYAHNHVINPETGFLENPAYISGFNSARKLQFLEVLKNNGLGLYRTCKAIGVKYDTVNKHYKIDPVFKQAYDQAMTEYIDELEATSRVNALNPKSVIERIFQLKCLLPEKYGQENRPTSINVAINLDGNMLNLMQKRTETIDVDPITSNQVTDEKVADNQGKRVLENNDLPSTGTTPDTH